MKDVPPQETNQQLEIEGFYFELRVISLILQLQALHQSRGFQYMQLQLYRRQVENCSELVAT